MDTAGLFKAAFLQGHTLTISHNSSTAHHTIAHSYLQEAYRLFESEHELLTLLYT